MRPVRGRNEGTGLRPGLLGVATVGLAIACGGKLSSGPLGAPGPVVTLLPIATELHRTGTRQTAGCSGSLVSIGGTTLILTAGHCCDAREVLLSTGRTVPLTHSYILPLWDGTGGCSPAPRGLDAALVTFHRNVGDPEPIPVPDARPAPAPLEVTPAHVAQNATYRVSADCVMPADSPSCHPANWDPHTLGGYVCADRTKGACFTYGDSGSLVRTEGGILVGEAPMSSGTKVAIVPLFGRMLLANKLTLSELVRTCAVRYPSKPPALCRAIPIDELLSQ